MRLILFWKHILNTISMNIWLKYLPPITSQVAQACDKSSYRDLVKMIPDTSEVKLRIRERYVVQITPGIYTQYYDCPSNRYILCIKIFCLSPIGLTAFRCSGLWPRSAAHWPMPTCPWPPPNIVAEVKAEGFDLLSKECVSLQVCSRSYDPWVAIWQTL